MREVRTRSLSDPSRLLTDISDGDGVPTDKAGNEFPTDWFDDDDLDERGQLVDSNGNKYDPFAGAMEPISGKCNAPLTNWRERYPSIRFCTQFVPNVDGQRRCRNHKNRGSLMKSAEEYVQTGVFSKTADHQFEHLDPYNKLLGWGLFESLMGDSTFEFAPESEQRTLDFTETVQQAPPEANNGILEVEVSYPTDYADRAVALFCAAMDSVAMLEVRSMTMAGGRSDEAGTMESEETADVLVDPNTGEQEEITNIVEHHLNLPYSRLVKDRTRLLEYGGVTTDSETSDTKSVTDADFVMSVDTIAESDGTESPNTFEDTAESERIVDSAGETEELSGSSEFADPIDEDSDNE